MVDLEETPAVPPFDAGGDERVGWWITGGLLLVIGWGFGVVGNLAVHLAAPASGLALGPVRVFPHLGPFAWITLGLGLFTGAVGVGLLWLARQSPRGPVVLPGYPY